MTQLVGTYGTRSTETLLRLLRGRAAQMCDVIELRLDFLPDAATRVAELVKASPKPTIATCRRAGDGGAFVGDERARLDLLALAADVGAAWIDVESSAPGAELSRLAGRGAKILRSLHAPTLSADADDVVRRLLAPPADAAKLVPLTSSAAEVVHVLDLVRRHSGKLAAHVADSPFSRYAGAACGSLFTYAALRPGGLIPAPLPTVRTTVERNRFGRLRAGAPLFVLIGRDVERSVSPDMLNAAFEAMDLPTVALRWSCDDPASALDAMDRFGWTGLAVTIPHKESVFELLRARGARLAPSAEETGAVNTVLRDGDVLVGHNTDVRGIVDSIRPFESVAPVTGKPALVLGAGGAARAAVRAAIQLGCAPIVVHARRPAAAEALVLLRRDGEPEILVAGDPADAAAVAPALVLQATPAGAAGEKPVFDFASLPKPAAVQEMIVSPTRTANETAALRAGHPVATGIAMLLHQAREQVRLATGREPDPTAMADAGGRALHRLGRTIVLVGLRCTGKTEVGERVARLVGLSFFDSDREVAARAGRSPDEMIRAGDEAAFRAIESEVLKDLLGRGAAVVATGGGAALHAPLLEIAATRAPIVLLDAADDVLLARLAATPRAPLTDLSPGDELRRQRAERGPVHRRVAWLELDVSRASPDETAEAISERDDEDWRGLGPPTIG